MSHKAATDFPVWIRDEGYAARVWVEDLEAAESLLRSLSNVFVFKTSEPIENDGRHAQCIFRVAYGSQFSHGKLLRFLGGLPGLRLRSAPAEAV